MTIDGTKTVGTESDVLGECFSATDISPLPRESTAEVLLIMFLLFFSWGFSLSRSLLLSERISVHFTSGHRLVSESIQLESFDLSLAGGGLDWRGLFLHGLLIVDGNLGISEPSATKKE